MNNFEKIKREARILILGFCILAVTAFVPPQSFARLTPQNHFVVLPADNPYADSAYFYLNFFQKQLSAVLGQPLDTTVTVYIASSESEFSSQARVELPDWGAGVAIQNQAKIIIKSPRAMPVGRSFRELLGHELTHIMLDRAAGGRWVPRWLHEGLAMYISGEWHLGQDILVARAAWTGNLIQLHALENLNHFRGPKASLAYTESYLAVSRLLAKSDPYMLHDLLEMYRQSNDFYGSWKRMTGQDYTVWIANWFNGVSRQYHFFIFLWDSEMFWIIVALIFILLFVAKKIQNKRVRRRWEIEEKLNPPDDSYKQYYDGYYDEENKV